MNTRKVEKMIRSFVTAYFFVQFLFLLLFSEASLIEKPIHSVERIGFIIVMTLMMTVALLLWYQRRAYDQTKWLVCMLFLYVLGIACKTSYPSVLFGTFLMVLPLAIFSWHQWKHSYVLVAMSTWLMLVVMKYLLFLQDVDIANRFTKGSFQFSWGIFAISLVVAAGLYFVGIYLPTQKRRWLFGSVLGLAIAWHVIVVAGAMYFKTYTFSTNTYDMGIFSQMFYSMSQGLGPITTLERDRVLSHFAVHFSPIVYLLLPVYWLFGSAESIQVMQIVIVLSGVIPVYLIGKKQGYDRYLIYLFMIMYVLSPALIGGSMFDFHENCFLAPLILWLLYFAMGNQLAGMGVMTVLILLIKEDAFIYLLLIGIYILVGNPFSYKRSRKKVMFILLVMIPLIYFLMVSHFLNNYGEGVMSNRFASLNSYSTLGLLGVVVTVFQNSTFLIINSLTLEKMIYAGYILGSLTLMPLLQKKASVYILVIPFLIINIFSDYYYQHHIGFQYQYGTFVLLFFIMMQAKWKQKTYYLLCLLAIAFSVATVSSTAFSLKYATYYRKPLSDVEITRAVLEQIPTEASVLATRNLTTFLARRPKIYSYLYHHQQQFDPEIDVVVVDLHVIVPEKRWILEQYTQNGYYLLEKVGENILIYERVDKKGGNDGKIDYYRSNLRCRSDKRTKPCSTVYD